jgi:methionyl-tRNA formyltransferase
MARALAALDRGSLDFKPQPEDGVTYAHKIDKAETRIDWSKPASEVHNLIRGLSPFPGAWFEIESAGKPIRVKALRSSLTDHTGVKADCADAPLWLTELQREGKGPMPADAFLRGTTIDVIR